MTETWYNSRKAAQVVAFFAGREGGEIPVLKLVKLIYLADREHMRVYGHPILDDRFVSMPHGPVNSLTLNFINGCESDDGGWDEFVASRANNSVGVEHSFSREDLDELSDAEVTQLESVWDQFGHMDKWQIRAWTHDNCPEWEDPKGSASPIPHARVLKYLGCKDAESLVDELKNGRYIEDVFATLR